jgi:hypothetical protein
MEDFNAAIICLQDMAVSYAECCINDLSGMSYNYQRAECLLTESLDFIGIDGKVFANESIDSLRDAREAIKPEIIKSIQGLHDSRLRFTELGL